MKVKIHFTRPHNYEDYFIIEGRDADECRKNAYKWFLDRGLTKDYVKTYCNVWSELIEN
jgi:hypothetical protein